MHNLFVRRVIPLLLCAAMLFGFSGCGKKLIEETAPEETTTKSVPKKDVWTPPATDFNRLTGLDDLSEEAKGKRPVAIMINNVKASLPQYGIAGADLMFECLVEGGITRMMAVFADYTKIPDVCSVRSCRYYFPVLAQGLDAYYICFGCNPTLGKQALIKTGIDYIDGNEDYDTDLFGRDPARLQRYKREHTAFVKGANIPSFMESHKIRTDYADRKDDYIFKFRAPKEVSDTPCETVRLNFSKTYYSTFTYDKDAKAYKKTHCGNPHMDTAANKQLQFTNVLILKTNVELFQGGPLVRIDWSEGTGYYLSYGTMREIKWHKKNYDAPIVVTNPNGKEIQINEGNSYIGFVNFDGVVI